MSGFWSSSALSSEPASDRESYNDLGVRDRVFTTGATETEGSPVYLFQSGHFSYQLLGAVGELAPFSLTSSGAGQNGVVRGQLAAKMQTVTATGAIGSPVELGAVTSGKSLYASFHAFQVGTTITVSLYSSPNSTFASKTLRATIGPITSRGGTWVTPVAAPITDTFYRFEATAITGTFVVGGAIAVQ
jgi:hypothetical protein